MTHSMNIIDREEKMTERLAWRNQTFSQIIYRFLPWNHQEQPHKIHIKSPLLYVAISSVLINLLSLTLPIAIIQAYDRIIPNKSYNTLLMLGLIVLGALLLECILKLLRSYILGWSAAVFEHHIFCHAMDHLRHADLVSIEERGTVSLILAFNAIGRLREYYAHQTAFLILTEFPFFFIYLGLLWYLGGWVVTVPLGLITVFIMYVWYEAGESMPQAREYDGENAHRLRLIMGVLKGLHTLKSFGSEKFFVRRYEELMKKISYLLYSMSMGGNRVYNLTVSLAQFLTIAISTVAVILFIYGEFGLGSLSACILLSGRLVSPFQKSIAFLQRTNELHLAQDKVDTVFNIPSFKKHDHLITEETPYGIELKDIVLHTKKTKTLVFDHLNLEIAANRCVAFHESPQMGRSTLLNLIGGLFPPHEGKILVGGMNPLFFSEDNHQKMIGFCAHNAPLFQGTIRENLTFFGNHTEESVEAIAKALGLDKATQFLPLGYETFLSDSFADPISPGVKQRIALVRCFAAQPKIILLDHADSSLDFIGVSLLHSYLQSLKGKRTIILVSNDPKILNLADAHYQLKDGTIEKVEEKK